MITNRTAKNRTPEIVSIADQIRALCAAVTKIARSDLQLRLENQESEITAIEHGLLRQLSQGITTMAEISRHMGVAPSTLVYVVDGLVRKNLVKRGKDPSDRRREPLLLTKQGADCFRSIPQMEESSTLVESLERMTQSRRRELLQLLSEFAEGLKGIERFRPKSDS